MSSESSWDNYRFVGEQLETREKREEAKLCLKLYSGSAGKESTCNAGDLGWIPRLGRSPGEGKACPLQYSGLENSKEYVVHGVTKSQTRLRDFHFTCSSFTLKKRRKSTAMIHAE